jgi:uncharacterized protein YuzE
MFLGEGRIIGRDAAELYGSRRPLIQHLRMLTDRPHPLGMPVHVLFHQLIGAHDPTPEQADAWSVRFRDAKPADNAESEDGVTADLDDQRRLIGIEILDVSRRFPPETLATVTVQNRLTTTP